LEKVEDRYVGLVIKAD